MAEKSDFKNGKLDLDLRLGHIHTTMHHSSICKQILYFIQFKNKMHCG